MIKPQIFIGSSGESLSVVNKIKSKLETEFDCISWDKDFFDANISTYENLIKKSVCFDYAIFVGGKDDKVTRISKGTKSTKVRDNVYLELGLYAGVLSPMRNYCLVHDDCTVASDLFGITIFKYNDEVGSVEECCENLIKTIKKEESNSRPTLLPANTLAFGYYDNFVKITSQLLDDLETIKLGEKFYDVQKLSKRLEIVLPKDVIADWDGWAARYYRKHDLHEILIQGKVKKMSVYLDKKVLEEKNEVCVRDIPQTLRASFKCVDMVTSEGTFGDTELQNKVKEKEVRNFAKTLEKLITKDVYSKEIVDVIYEAEP